MTDIPSDRWRRLLPLLDRVIDLDAEARRAYLHALRGDDEELRDDLARLVADHDCLQSRALPTAMKMVTRALALDFQEERIAADR